VEGYSPEEAVTMSPRTTIQGMVAKNTNEEPFAMPERVLKIAVGEKENIPICFLTNGDTTGGSSGSPTLNGRGELVGVNFDRVWKNIAGDFGWNPDYSRNINVDIRFILWMLYKVEKAETLLKELTQ
jgi:Peptidase S46